MRAATTTANGQFNYKDTYFQKSLDAWVQEIRGLPSWKEEGASDTWTPGEYRYDALAMSIAYVFVFVETQNSNERHMCMAFHQGWMTNYAYWCDWVPWLDCYTRYIATEPLEPLQPQNVAYSELNMVVKERIIQAVQHLQETIRTTKSNGSEAV